MYHILLSPVEQNLDLMLFTCLFLTQPVGSQVKTWRAPGSLCYHELCRDHQPHEQPQEPALSQWPCSPQQGSPNKQQFCLMGSLTPVAPQHCNAQFPHNVSWMQKLFTSSWTTKKAKLYLSTIWKEFTFFHSINLTFKHQAAVFIFMGVNSTYYGPQLLWQLL